MNKQRKVLITITYNEMGIIIDTKAEEVAQPNLQLTCNQLATDCISRQAAKEYIDSQTGRPFIGCTIGEAMKIMLDEIPSVSVGGAEDINVPVNGSGWIPCSERMPPVDIAVLISFRGTTPADNHPGRTYIRAMDLATWDGPEEGWFIWSMNSVEAMNAVTVEAWMELPPMYQPEDKQK